MNLIVLDNAPLISELRAIVAEEARKNRNNPSLAAKSARKRLEEHKDFAKFTDYLIDIAVRALLDEARHIENRQFKRNAGAYIHAPKVVGGKALAKAQCELFLINIGGYALGSLKGEQLEPIGTSLIANGDGMVKQGRLCIALRKHTPDGKMVKEAVSADLLRTIYNKIVLSA